MEKNHHIVNSTSFAVNHPETETETETVSEHLTNTISLLILNI